MRAAFSQELKITIITTPDTSEWTVPIANPPVWVTPVDTNVNLLVNTGTTIKLPRYRDEDGDEVTLALDSVDSAVSASLNERWLTIDAGSTPGTFTVAVKMTDDSNSTLSTTTTLSVVVTDPDAPEESSEEPSEEEESSDPEASTPPESPEDESPTDPTDPTDPADPADNGGADGPPDVPTSPDLTASIASISK